jgi:hypothetical protein
MCRNCSGRRPSSPPGETFVTGPKVKEHFLEKLDFISGWISEMLITLRFACKGRATRRVTVFLNELSNAN